MSSILSELKTGKLKTSQLASLEGQGDAENEEDGKQTDTSLTILTIH